MKLKRHNNFINEYQGHNDVRNDMIKKLKKKVGARNLNSQIEYRDNPRDRLQINWNMFHSLYVQHSVEDHSLVDNENWKYVFNNINVHSIPHNEKGKDLIEHIIKTYKPSQEEIKSLFTHVAISKSNPVTEYLIPMIDEKSLSKMISDVLPYGFGYVTNKAKLAKLFYDLGLYKFEGEKESNNLDWRRNPSQEMLLKFMGHRKLDEIAWEVISKDSFEWKEVFFKTLVKSPTNGGLYSNDDRFKDYIDKFSNIQTFEDHVLSHPSVIEFKDSWNKPLLEFLPERIQKHPNVLNYIKSRGGISKFKL